MRPIYLSRPAVVTCAGLGIEALWRAAVDADQSHIKTRRAVSGKEFFAGMAEDTLLPKGMNRIFALTQAALNLMAGETASAISLCGKSRVAVCVGSCDNGSEASFAAYKEFAATHKFPKGYMLKEQGASGAAEYVAKACGATGPALSFATACSSSASSMMRGAELLLAGEADAVIAGGVDLASDVALLGFDSLEAVSDEKSNPFSINRKGITLGEGAAFFLMTRKAMEGGCGVALIGMGESADAHHMTSPLETGEYAADAMRHALKDAGLLAGEVDYVNLHGTGTKQNDAMEARAMEKVFGEGGVACSSTKSITGHTLGAAGAVEAAVCWAALAFNSGDGNAAREGFLLPVQSWDGEYDTALPHLDIIGKGRTASRQPKVCMTNTFAFGGLNASMILGIESKGAEGRKHGE